MEEKKYYKICWGNLYNYIVSSDQNGYERCIWSEVYTTCEKTVTKCDQECESCMAGGLHEPGSFTKDPEAEAKLMTEEEIFLYLI